MRQLKDLKKLVVGWVENEMKVILFVFEIFIYFNFNLKSHFFDCSLKYFIFILLAKFFTFIVVLFRVSFSHFYLEIF